jgi:MYXO-CTERM domain-containing protein
MLGLFTPDAEAGLKVTLTTSPAGGVYAPAHVVAVWVETQAGVFVKTIGRWSAARTSSLVTWLGKAGQGDADAVSGATQNTQPDTLTLMEWNLEDRQGNIVPDGTYTIRMELSDSNPGQGTPNLGTFTFVKSADPQVQTNLANGGFSAVTIDFTPAAPATCGNGVADTGETCDPMIASGQSGACVTECTASADACMPNTLVGAATSCDAACEVVTISTCVDADGCCPDGCDGLDADCGGGNNADGPELSGGCSTGGGTGAALAILGLGFFVPRRRKQG